MPDPSDVRVSVHTGQDVNNQIQEQTRKNIAYYGSLGNEAIDRRLRELDAEWDIEQSLETNMAAVSFTGILFSVVSGKRWLLLPLAAAGFLMQHALQGWSPPMSLLRRLGFRTRAEIDHERYALKALRGDFKDMPPAAQNYRDEAGKVLEAALR